MKTLSIANQKGGVGKTTTVLNLGAGLAQLGGRVLLMDLDPQSSLTLATVGECSGRSLAEVLGDTKPGRLSISKVIQNIGPGLDIAPADIALSNTELGLVTRIAGESALKKALAGVTGYDLVLMDCGPSLGLLVVNALACADAVICPTLPTALDLRGVRLFLGSLEEMREINPGLQLLGVLVCQYDSRLNLHRAALEDLRAGELPVLPMTISKSVKAAAAAGAGEPVDRGSLADQYRELAEYVNRWLKT